MLLDTVTSRTHFCGLAFVADKLETAFCCLANNCQCSLCSDAKGSCVCQWKNITAGEMVILECAGHGTEASMTFFAVSHIIQFLQFFP